MRKRVKKPWLGAALCLLLWVVSPLAALAAEAPDPAADGEPEPTDISETMRLVYADEEMSVYEVMPLEGDFSLKPQETIFSTNFSISIYEEVTTYQDGAAVVGFGGTGRGGGDGFKIASAGMDFRPPLIAALFCGAGYIACAGFKKYANYANDREDN